VETKGHAVVLIVKDDAFIRLAAADVVREAGYDAFEAANADIAIALLEEHSEIRGVFTDIEMPGSIDGMKLAACIRDRWPPISIIVTSQPTGGLNQTGSRSVAPSLPTPLRLPRQRCRQAS
jgi:CheY-like chemotaxis protein